MVKNKFKLPIDKVQVDKLIDDYFAKDKHEWPSWMGIGQGDNEVRYDYDSSKVCYSLIRHLKPVSVFECGTSFGHSAVFINDALQKNKLPYVYVGFEMEGDLYKKTVENIEKRFDGMPPEITLINDNVTNSAVLEYIPETLDFAFIDTNHEETSTQWYVDNIFPRLVPGALVAIHDFAVDDRTGEWVGKGPDGSGGLEETRLLIDLQRAGELPLEKLYWTYPDRDLWGQSWEGSFWIYTGNE